MKNKNEKARKEERDIMDATVSEKKKSWWRMKTMNNERPWTSLCALQNRWTEEKEIKRVVSKIISWLHLKIIKKICKGWNWCLIMLVISQCFFQKNILLILNHEASWILFGLHKTSHSFLSVLHKLSSKRATDLEENYRTSS